MSLDFAKIEEETKWLKNHLDFDERPATIDEFLGSDYLNIKLNIRDGVRNALVDIFDTGIDEERIAAFERALFTGAIGVGKTTLASIALAYMSHWILCLKDPQKYYGLLPGSKIAFMMMSTSESQAREVIFGDTKARIDNSKWFKENYPYDPAFKRQIRFSKNIWILPGDSAETSFEGYNILGGILDEADSHRVTKDKDYAQIGYDTIESRIASRFVDNSDPSREGHKGIIIVIGQMKKGNGFAHRTYESFKKDPRAYVIRLAIWESFGWDKYTDPITDRRNSFWYDVKRKIIVPSGVGEIMGIDNVIEIPEAFRTQFKNNPEKALRDLGGIPPATSDPFISLVDRIESARDTWVLRTGYNSPVGTSSGSPVFAEWFRANGDPRKRVLHVDLAYSAAGDALGMAMGHVSHLVDIDGENKPYIIIDFVARIKAAPGTEIMLSDVRHTIYYLRDDLGFKLKKVTYDGFESTDTIQQLRKRRFDADTVSMDKSTLPYEDLREAIYEGRIEYPKYMTSLKKGEGEYVEILIKELSELTFDGKKVDHPSDATGSKDCADAVAGVVYTLMGDRSYRRGVVSTDVAIETPATQPEFQSGHLSGESQIGRFPGLGANGLRAPLPPTGGGMGDLGLTIPSRLRPRGR